MVEKTQEQHRALVSLLGDEDPKILTMVRELLLKAGPAVVPALEEGAEHRDPRVRIRSRHILARIRADLLEEEFNKIAHWDPARFRLEEALVVVARIEYPKLRKEEVSRKLDALARALKQRLRGDMSLRQKIETMNAFLFDELGFRGNTRDHYDPDNNYLNRVLERRLGIPISLSVVYMLLGERLGIPLKGVGLPGNFLVKLAAGRDEIFLDPYHGGRLLTRRDCAQMLTEAGYYFKEEYIAEASPRDIVIRTLRNLLISYSKKQEKLRIREITHYMGLLQKPQIAP
jgi:regulator of sirC expression with transglutaminase-like and TPR domain